MRVSGISEFFVCLKNSHAQKILVKIYFSLPKIILGREEGKKKGTTLIVTQAKGITI